MSTRVITTTGGLRTKKERGAFFTPLPVSRFIAQWAVRGPSDRILEPSCGEASFLVAAAETLGEQAQLPLFGHAQLTGVEFHAPSISVAERNLRSLGASAHIIHSDFFDLEPTAAYDAVIGNPPFVRYQDFAGDGRAKALRAAMKVGVNLSGLASSWAAFVVHAASFLNQAGRLGFVLPAELLTVNYAAPVRSFLLRRFAKVRLTIFEELVFPDALEDVVLLTAEGSGGCDHFEVRQVRNAAALANQSDSDWVHVDPLQQTKWTHALVQRDDWETFRAALDRPGIERLGEWGRTYLGAVTGDNKYFNMSDGDIARWRISEADLLPISPPGSRHLRGTTMGSGMWQALRREGKPCQLFYPRDGKLNSAAANYVDHGVRLGVPNAYKCRARTPWYQVPIVAKPDIFLTYMDQSHPRMVSNQAGVYHLNSLYGIKLAKGRVTLGRDLLPIASLNSLTLLGAEVVGRSYGGGMLKLEPREADQLPLPGVDLLAQVSEELRILAPLLAVELRNGRIGKAAEMVDQLILLDSGVMKESELVRIREARQLLYNRRTVRGRSIAE